MIKRIIFDMDNTLIFWEDEYWKSLNKTLDKLYFNYDQHLINKLIDAVNIYEEKYTIYNKEDMLTLMNKYIDQSLPSNFIDAWLDELALCIGDDNKEVIDALQYLYNKYDLVVLTNWFASSQIKRLENAYMLNYFSHIFGADSFLMKPNKESFLTAIEGYQTSECLMIGDSLQSDIEGASRIGINVIYYDYKNKNISTKYPTISTFSQLKDML